MPSTVIRRHDYDEATRVLEITFVTGRVYIYADVPPDVYDDFRAARSKGEFFNTRIRDAYPYREVTAAG